MAAQDAGVASATVTVGQQLGASIGTSLLNTIFATAVASYVAAHALTRGAALNGLAVAHGYDTALWWTCGIAAGSGGAAAVLLLRGPVTARAQSPSTSLQPASSLGPTDTSPDLA